ncbi:MAG: hypothetical protein ACTHLN_07090 [Tepidisphaeraceae bacterium]
MTLRTILLAFVLLLLNGAVLRAADAPTSAPAETAMQIEGSRAGEAVRPPSAAENKSPAHGGAIMAVLTVLTFGLTFPMRSLVRHGRGKALVLGFFLVIVAGGAVELIAGAWGMLRGKPADAWLSLLSCGAIMLGVPLLVMRDVRWQYARYELRKLQAMDVG